MEFLEKKIVREAKCCRVVFGRRVYSAICQLEIYTDVIVRCNLKFL